MTNIKSKLNYNTIESEYRDNNTFYNDCAEQVIDYCNERKISYHIKNKTISV